MFNEDEENEERVMHGLAAKKFSMLKHKIINSIDPDELSEMVDQVSSLSRNLMLIDVVTNIIDVATVFIFYNDHFDYIDNNLKISKNSNILRTALIGTSVIVCLLLLVRFRMKKVYSNILFNLEVKDKPFYEKRYLKYLFIEIFVHILQPYPKLEYSFTMDIVGSPITYSLNMVLYFFSTFRFYNLIKVIRFWNLYSTPRSKKILKFFDNKSKSDMFLYKANLDHRGFITLSCLGIITLIYFSLLLKVLEYYKRDKDNPFNYYINSIWYLIVTMGTIGYGDITPKTVMGRIVGAFVCLVGVVVLSLIVVTLTIFTYLDNDEIVAYDAINSLYTTGVKKEKINNYIKRLLHKWIRNKLKHVNLKCVIDNYTLGLDKVQCNIELKKQRPTKNIHNEFINAVRSIANEHFDIFCEGFQGMWEFEEELEDYLTSNDNLGDSCRNNKNLMLSCLNLAKCLTTVGSIRKIRNIDEIQHKKLLSHNEFRIGKKKYIKSVSGTSSSMENSNEKVGGWKSNGDVIRYKRNLNGSSSSLECFGQEEDKNLIQIVDEDNKTNSKKNESEEVNKSNALSEDKEKGSQVNENKEDEPLISEREKEIKSVLESNSQNNSSIVKSSNKDESEDLSDNNRQDINRLLLKNRTISSSSSAFYSSSNNNGSNL